MCYIGNPFPPLFSRPSFCSPLALAISPLSLSLSLSLLSLLSLFPLSLSIALLSSPLPLSRCLSLRIPEPHLFCLYRTMITTGPLPNTELSLQGFGDRANVFVDGNYVGVLQRDYPPSSLSIMVPSQQARLDILVENMGRIEYGK